MKNKANKVKEDQPKTKGMNGLQGRWLRNTVGVILALILVCTVVLSCVVHSAYYADMKEDLATQADLITQLVCADTQSTEDYPSLSVELLQDRCKIDQAITVQYVDASTEIVACDGIGMNPNVRGKPGTSNLGEDVLEALESSDIVV